MGWQPRPQICGPCLVDAPLAYLIFPWEGPKPAPWGSSLTHHPPLQTGCFMLAKTVYFSPCWRSTLEMICVNKSLIALFSLGQHAKFYIKKCHFVFTFMLDVLKIIDLKSLKDIPNGNSFLQWLSFLLTTKHQTKH